MTWIVVVQVLLWSGLALRVHQYGWRPYWATEVLAGVQLYMTGAADDAQQRRLEARLPSRR